MRLILLLLAGLFVFGCGTMKFDRHDRPYSEREFQKDFTECEAMNPQGNSIPGRNYIQRCMFGRGWDRVE